jgi:osmotically-inducible protein OsmY
MVKEETLKKRIVDQLYWDSRVDASNIEVRVDDSKVELNGTVPNYTTRQVAVLDTWSVSGIKKVEDNLKVKFPPKLKIPSDKELKKRVKNKFFWNSAIDSSKLDVSVEAGIVNLEGTIDSYWKKLRAENITSNMIGVLDVNNKLAVVPTESYIDTEIAEDIVSAIDRRYDVDVEDVDVKVKNGTVTLTGQVPRYYTYQAVMHSAENTSGVIDVVDHLVIK